MEQPQPIELNIFQRGILQKCATVFVYLTSILTGAWILDWLDKLLFIRLAEEAQRQKFLSPEATRGFTRLIEARDSTVIIAVIMVGLACGFAGWLFMRWAAKRNWSWPVTLPKAVEFRSAMEQLGIAGPADRVAFVRKHKLPVFIALSPLIGKEHAAVRAKLYAFAHSAFGVEEVFEQHTGKQTLCLNADDFERVLKEHGEHTKTAYSVRIAELEQDVANLKAVNSLQSADIAKLTEENEKLLVENADQRNKLKTLPAREENAESREEKRVPFWRVAVPLVNRLIAEAPPGTQYTRPEIQDAFLQELENFPELKRAIQNLLRTAKKEGENTPFALDGWGMEAIRLALGDLAKKEGGATRKTGKHRSL
jgi:uncharacterized membrane protein/regulator of replication initiation timing